MNVEAARKTIAAIYDRHGFYVEAWTDGRLKARVKGKPELLGLPMHEAQERIQKAWKEIDAVIHEVVD